MNSRRRIITALNHEEPDHIPVDFGATPATGIHKIAYRNILDYFGYTDREIVINDTIQQLAKIDEDIQEKLGIDVRGLAGKPPSDWTLSIKEKGEYLTFIDQWGIGWRKPKVKGLYFDLMFHPFAEMETIKEVEKYKLPDPQDPMRFHGLRKEAEEFRQKNDPALVLDGISAGFTEMACWLRGYENFFLDMAGNKKMAEAILNKTLQNKIKYWEKALTEFGDLIDIVVEADDFASQQGMIISPDMYRELIKPRQKKLFETIKDVKDDVYIFFHSCGAVYDIIPDLIEVGIDILNPVQVSAVNMDSAQLNKEFGDDVSFWGGGVDTQNILNSGTTNEVKEEVKKRIDDFAPGGGFIFSSVHNVQADVPPENFMAMWETWKEYGKY